jgi:hypothetical protein
MSRLDKLKEQHPDLNVSLIDIITSLDPTGTYKYTDFLIKNFKRDNQYYSPNLDELKGYLGVSLFGSNEIEVLNEFERHSRANRIKEKDISKYNNFLELHEQVKIAEDIEKQKEVEKQILKIHEDDTWLVLTPLSFEASRVYGSNTKWCTTQERYWDRYLKTHRLVYCINKKIDIINIHQGNSGTTDYSNVVDRIRSLMDNNRYNSTWTSEPYGLPLEPSNEIVIDTNVPLRRISDYPIVSINYDGDDLP